MLIFYIDLIFRYLYLQNNTPENKNTWNSALQEYILGGQVPSVSTTVLEQVKTMNCENLHDQLSILSSISNFHWWQYIRCDGKISSTDICVNLTHHLLYHPICEQEIDTFKIKYIPKSPRNTHVLHLH